MGGEMENMEGSCRFDQFLGMQKPIATQGVEVELRLGILTLFA